MKTGALTELKSFISADQYSIVQSFIHSSGWNELGTGKWKFFEEAGPLKVIVLNKSNYKEGVKEYHKEFSDLHITIHGADTMNFGDMISEVIEEYQADGDYSIVKSSTECSVKILPGHFVLIPPGEMHANELNGEAPLKVVFKMK